MSLKNEELESRNEGEKEELSARRLVSFKRGEDAAL